MAIDATVGGATSNSYVTLTEAEAYFAARLNSATWTAASAGDKEAALLSACRHIDACRIRVHRRPYGYPTALAIDLLEQLNNDQALKFPRQRDRDAAGTYIIPQPAKDAQCEEALALLAHGAEQARRRSLQAGGVESFSVDGLTESFREGAGQHPLESMEARTLLMPYIDKTGILATSEAPDGEWTPGSRP